MASNIYKFFDFLEKKAGKTLSPAKKAMMTVRHAREFVDDSVVEDLTIEDRIKYAPDTLEGSPPIIVAGGLDLRDLTHLPPHINIKKVKGHLNLSNLKQIPKGFNPTVEGLLDLQSIITVPEGFNPVVGGLWLSNATSIPDSFNPTVTGTLDLSNYKFAYKTKKDLHNRFPNAQGIIYVNNK